MIGMSVEMTPLETRIRLISQLGESMKPQMQRIAEMLLESNLVSLDAGGRPTAFRPNKTGTLPLGGRSGHIGRSEHIASVGDFSAVLEASGERFNAIHQLGGTINHPGSKKFQVFKIGSSLIFTHGTKPHPILIPARRYFRIQDEDVVKAKEILSGAITK